jgi:hypothetical protein
MTHRKFVAGFGTSIAASAADVACGCDMEFPQKIFDRTKRCLSNWTAICAATENR